MLSLWNTLKALSPKPRVQRYELNMADALTRLLEEAETGEAKAQRMLYEGCATALLALCRYAPGEGPPMITSPLTQEDLAFCFERGEVTAWQSLSTLTLFCVQSLGWIAMRYLGKSKQAQRQSVYTVDGPTVVRFAGYIANDLKLAKHFTDKLPYSRDEYLAAFNAYVVEQEVPVTHQMV